MAGGANAAHQDLESFLTTARKKVAAGQDGRITVRELLGYANAERRGVHVVAAIQAALDRYGLTTEPSFASGWIDNEVTFRSTATSNKTPSAGGAGADGGQDGGDHDQTDVALTVATLHSANAGVVSVERNDDLARAQALMLKHDYSQLAVLSGARQLVGAVSWESIAIATLRGGDLSLGAATVPATSVPLDANLLALIPRIVEEGFVFVSQTDRTLAGIVTPADLSRQFETLAGPFLLLGEMERRLRHILGSCFEVSELAAVRNPADDNRTIESIADLTLGEMARLIEQPDRWSKLAWPFDRQVFINALEEVRDIRNDVMHFSPDPLSLGQDAALKNFVKWLRLMTP